jgi:hypothetical protein
LAGTVPPVNVTLPDVDVTTPPVQVVAVPGDAARTKPAPGDVGNVSVTLVIEIGPAFGLLMVIVSSETPPELTVAGKNAFARVGADAVTVKVAVFDALPVAASLLETPDVVFGNVPGVLLDTDTDTVHEPFAGMLRPLKLRLVWLIVKALPEAPVHVPPAAPVAPMNMPLSMSVKAALVKGTPLLFEIVKVIVLVPPIAMLDGLKALAIVGVAAVTLSVAVFEAAPVAASLAVTPDDVFGLAPGTLLVTTRVTVQDPAAGIVNPVKESAPV